MEGEDRKSALQSTRDLILEYVKAHPGDHLRKIARELKLGNGDLQYNLYVLEKEGRICEARHGLYKVFFPTGVYAQDETAILAALSTESQREILIHIIRNPTLSQNQLAKLVKLTPATISWHMKRLAVLGIVSRTKDGRQVTYRVVGNEASIERFVRSYHPTFWEKLSSKLTDIVLEMSSDNQKERP